MKFLRINWRRVFLLTSLAFVLTAGDSPYKKYDHPMYPAELFEYRLKEVLPPDAAEYVDRFRDCQHWQGEDAYDEERGEEIRKGLQDNCTGLKEKELHLQFKYKNGTIESKLIKSIIKEIEEGKTFPSFMFNDPHRRSVILNEYYESNAQYIIREVNKQIPEYEATKGSLRKNADNRSMDKLKNQKFMLEVQLRYLTDVLKNIDRLHPITQKQIKHIKPKLMTALSLGTSE